VNICMFTNTYPPHVGGVARSVSTFAADLHRQGHRVMVVAPTFPETRDQEGAAVRVVRVPAIQNFNGSDFSVRVAMPFLLTQAIDDFAPDIIHSHHPFLLGDAALRTAKYRHLPLFFTHHTLYERYTHYVPLDSPTLKRFVIHLSTEYSNLCTRIIAPSCSIAELIAQRGVTRPIDVIPTGIDTRFFAAGDGKGFRQRYGLPEDSLVVGHVGRLALEKNLAFLTRAVALFLRQDPAARFLVAGKGPGEQEIRDICQEHGVADRLVMVGILQGDDLSGAYRAMDIFVFSSQSETQGMVLAEALAAGNAVVALDGPGVREVVRDNDNGRLLPADGSYGEFAGAIRQLAEDATFRQNCRARAGRVAELFARERCVAKLIDAYRVALALPPERLGREDDAEQPWENLLTRIETEWDLLAEKASALFDSLDEEEEKIVRNDKCGMRDENGGS